MRDKIALIEEVERATNCQLEKIGKMLDDVMKGAAREAERCLEELKRKGGEMVKGT